MRARRSALLTASLASALLLAACTAGNDPSPPEAAGSGPGPAAAAAACELRDEQPLTASLAPGEITTSPSSWPADSTMAAIRERGSLVVGTSADAELWGARDPETGAFEGYDIELANAVARELGVPVTYRVLTLSQRIPALADGRVDLVAERVSITCGRWVGDSTTPSVNLSTGYYQAGQRVLVRQDLPATSIEDLSGQPVCVAAGGTSERTLDTFVESAQVEKVTVSESGECLVKMQEGEVVAITGDDATLAGYEAQDQYTKIIGPSLFSSEYALATRSDAPDFTRYINAVLERLRADGTLAELNTRWMKTDASAVPAAVYGRDIEALQRES